MILSMALDLWANRSFFASFTLCKLLNLLYIMTTNRFKIAIFVINTSSVGAFENSK